jgi:three-Cys-motif partner protein
MNDRSKLKLDEIGYWSEIKLDIVREYASAYSTILCAQQKSRFHHVYIDAFCGAGVHLSKSTGAEIDGSPIIAVNTQPPFKEYHFIDLDGRKVEHLRRIIGERPDVYIHHGDCNEVMLNEVLPRVRWEEYRRGLCLLDPYGLHLNWEVIRTAGQMKTIDLFLNFPVADMNRNVFWRNPEFVAEDDIARMSAFWGDDSWRRAAYAPVKDGLFEIEEKTDNDAIAAVFRERLKKVAGFSYVPEPLPMRNTRGVTVYYLFFASPKSVAENIITDIFTKYRSRGRESALPVASNPWTEFAGMFKDDPYFDEWQQAIAENRRNMDADPDIP